MVTASHKRAQISPLKVRIAVKMLKSTKGLFLPIEKALNLLHHSPNKASKLLLAVLKSAVANAENNHNCDIDGLRLKTICIDEGPVLKRMMPRARGRGDRIIKRSSHITVEVCEMEGGN